MIIFICIIPIVQSCASYSDLVTERVTVAYLNEVTWFELQVNPERKK